MAIDLDRLRRQVMSEAEASAAADEVERLQATDDKLPKTADGVPVVPHVDPVWAWDACLHEAKPRWWRGGDHNWVYGELEHETVRVSECYSSPEAAEAADKRSRARRQRSAWLKKQAAVPRRQRDPRPNQRY